MGVAVTALGIKQHAVASNSELMFRMGLFAPSVCTALDDGDVLQIPQGSTSEPRVLSNTCVALQVRDT